MLPIHQRLFCRRVDEVEVKIASMRKSLRVR
jgi:hypothetical protein